MASFRKLVGATNPLSAEPGTIRGDFGRVTGRNIVHASDSADNGVREAGMLRGTTPHAVPFNSLSSVLDMCALVMQTFLQCHVCPRRRSLYSRLTVVMWTQGSGLAMAGYRTGP